MGRIADEVRDTVRAPWTNKVDDILDELDDADRAVVLGWLLGDVGGRRLSFDLAGYGIDVSQSSVERWRLAQSAGVGRVWAA